MVDLRGGGAVGRTCRPGIAAYIQAGDASIDGRDLIRSDSHRGSLDLVEESEMGEHQGCDSTGRIAV